MKKRNFWSLYYLAVGCLLVSLVLLTGCKGQHAQVIEQDTFLFKMTIDPKLETLGLAEWSPSFCKIWLREYPTCLLHEIRHCIEGEWHKGHVSDRDCY